jgi:hypothetical protein
VTTKYDFCSFETTDVIVFAVSASKGNTELKVLGII